MSTMDKLASELKTLMTESDNRKPKPYDTDATVIRVEDDILWVHIPGGVEETPIRKTINASIGDNVKVHVGGGSAWIVGNASAPPTDDTKAIAAEEKAVDAKLQAVKATNYANEAQIQADRAKEMADDATLSAEKAQTSADEATKNAQDAIADANRANAAANASTYHLSEIEKVVDVLNWLAEHGDPEDYEITNDTEIVEGKWYFILNSEGAYVIGSPISNPRNEGFYELKSIKTAVTQYVSTHLYLVNGDGLYVRMDENLGAKLKITGTGIYLLDSTGKTIAQYSSTVILGDPDSSHIELSPAYGLGFYQSKKEEDQDKKPTNRVAYIQDDRLYIQSATLSNNLQIGNFRWVVLDHRISLKYNPIK